MMENARAKKDQLNEERRKGLDYKYSGSIEGERWRKPNYNIYGPDPLGKKNEKKKKWKIGNVFKNKKEKEVEYEDIDGSNWNMSVKQEWKQYQESGREAMTSSQNTPVCSSDYETIQPGNDEHAPAMAAVSQNPRRQEAPSGGAHCSPSKQPEADYVNSREMPRTGNKIVPAEPLLSGARIQNYNTGCSITYITCKSVNITMKDGQIKIDTSQDPEEEFAVVEG